MMDCPPGWPSTVEYVMPCPIGSLTCEKTLLTAPTCEKMCPLGAPLCVHATSLSLFFLPAPQRDCVKLPLEQISCIESMNQLWINVLKVNQTCCVFELVLLCTVDVSCNWRIFFFTQATFFTPWNDVQHETKPNQIANKPKVSLWHWFVLSQISNKLTEQSYRTEPSDACMKHKLQYKTNAFLC